MKKIIFTLLSIFTISAYGIDIASCSNQEGYAYYSYSGLIAKKDSGWVKDGITGGRISVVKNNKNEYDLLYVDTQKGVYSSKADGGHVVVIRSSSKDFVVLVAYDSTSELYSFWQNNEGKLQYSHLQSKGAGLALTKSSAMVGVCDFINFNSVK